jgi:hypothetical protein
MGQRIPEAVRRWNPSKWIVVGLALWALPVRNVALGEEPREIRPPFELIWHESADRLERLIVNAKLTVVEKTRTAKEANWTVTGFKKPNPKNPAAPKPPELRRVVFSFRDQQLCAVELQYEQEGWVTRDYDTSFAQKRDALDRLYGPGQTMLRETGVASGVDGEQTVVSAVWNRNNASIQLAYYALENAARQQAFRCLSLRYSVQ